MHQPALVPAVEFRSMTARQVGRVWARRSSLEVVVHRDGDVAPEQLAEVDEAVPVDRVADDEDSRRVRSSFPQERDRIFATARGGARRQRVGGDLAVLFREDIGLILRR